MHGECQRARETKVDKTASDSSVTPKIKSSLSLESPKNTFVILCCAAVVIGLISFIGYQHHQEVAEHTKAASAVEALIRQDRAGIEMTLNSSYSGHNTNNGEMHDFSPQNREEVMLRARSLDYTLFPEVDGKYIELVDAENNLIRDLEALHKEDVTLRLYRIDHDFSERYKLEGLQQNEYLARGERAYSEAFKRATKAAPIVLSDLEKVTALEQRFKTLTASENIKYEPVIIKRQDDIRKDAHRDF